MAGNSNGREGKNAMVPKTEDVNYEFPPYTTFSRDFGVCCRCLNLHTRPIQSNASIKKLQHKFYDWIGSVFKSNFEN